jgi:AraC-like DNA-binding protein
VDINIKILPASPLLSPYIEYYKFISGSLQGAYKVVPSFNQEMYFSFDPYNYCISSPNRYEVRNPHMFMMGLHDVGQEIYTHIPENRPLKSFVIVFKPNGIQKLFRLSNSEIQEYSLYGNDVLKADSDIILTSLHKARDANAMKTEIENFLHSYIKKSKIDPLLQSISTYIRQNSGISSVGALADKFHITPRTLQRRFNNEFGISPKNYLQLVRINTAVGMLSSGNYESLTELAYYSGYYDQSHFIRDVKKTCGTLPGIMEKGSTLMKCENIHFTSIN